MFVLLGLALFSVSCEHKIPEEAVVPARRKEASIPVEILLRTPEAFGPVTRSLTDADEISVKDVLVLFFRESDMKLHSVTEGRRLSPVAGSQGRVIAFETSFSVEAALASQRFVCMVLANVAERFDSDTRLSWRWKTYNELQLSLLQSVSGKLYTASPSSMAMWGRATQALVPSKPRQKLSVPLLRSVARVDVSVVSGITNFILDDVYVYKPNNALSLMPGLTAFSAADRKVTAPSVPASAAALADKWLYSVRGNSIDHSIYIPEADIIMGGEGTPGDAHHLDRCALVVGARYPAADSPKTYYRIDFKKGGTEPSGQLMDVLRNYRYNIHITKVMGRGEDTPDKAYEARTTEISAEVVPWTDNNQEIVFDGVNWASVERKRMDFGDAKGIEDLLDLFSNVKPSQWSMEFSLPDGTVTGAESSEASLVGRYFEVTKPKDKPDDVKRQGGGLSIRTKQALPEYDSQNKKNTVLHERLIVRIGKLELVIDLYQHPYSDTDWDDGGRIEHDF